MRFNQHLHLVGEHAFLSPSSYHWINYTASRLVDRWMTAQAAMRGSAQHEYAKEEIEAGRLSQYRGTLGMYINDCIENRMTCEQTLYYSENCFGTADAISFRYRKLRIFDLKTGTTKASMRQLEVYVAIFCLEYGMNPYDIKIELRIYQADDVLVYEPDPEDIEFIMNKIIESDRTINLLRLEEEV